MFEKKKLKGRNVSNETILIPQGKPLISENGNNDL